MPEKWGLNAIAAENLHRWTQLKEIYSPTERNKIKWQYQFVHVTDTKLFCAMCSRRLWLQGRIQGANEVVLFKKNGAKIQRVHGIFGVKSWLHLKPFE